MGSTGLLLLLIIFMGGMLFVSSRQRKKQQQQHEDLQSSIEVGDVVRMTSGISGTVVDIDDEQTLDIEIAEDVVTTWLRAAVREKLTPDVEHLDDAADTDDPATEIPELADAPTPPADAVGGTPSTATPSTATPSADATGPGASRNGSEPSGEVSSPRSS